MEMDFDGLYRFHGHRCPMSTMGARLGRAAMDALGATKADQFNLYCEYMSRNCALDGIQYTTGCTLGNGNLESSDSGRASLTLTRRDGGGSVTASVSEEALERFRKHKEKKALLENERRSGSGGVSGMEDELRAEFDALVEWVQGAPDEKLIVITRA